MKTIRLALILSIIALVTTACFRIELAFTVNDDGSGTVSYQIAVNDALIELGGEDLNFSEELGDLPPGAEVQDYSEDGYTGVVVTVRAILKPVYLTRSPSVRMRMAGGSSPC